MKKKVSIVDYDQGNIVHIVRACENVGFKVSIATTEKDILNSDKLILPGVGRFGTAIKNLKHSKLDISLKKIIQKQIPILGICLGFQILFEMSKEDENTQGLAILKGKFLKFSRKETDKVLQIQWNKIQLNNKSVLLKTVKENDFFYFNHSYFLDEHTVEKESIRARVNYNNITFPCVVEKDNIFGTQFHPEKSGKKGLKILDNFKNI